MTSTMADALCELGGALPTALETVVTHTQESTALECVRHAACTGAVDALKNPPPVLLHESKLTSTNILYGGVKPGSVDDAGYRHAPAEELARVRPGEFAGAAMMDVCEGRARPATVWTLDKGTHTLIEVRVYEAPIAAMEVELFDTTAKPRAFEYRWYKEGVQNARDYRGFVAKNLRRRGYHSMPVWMHSGEYAIERPGVLPLLRLRQSKDASEDESIARLLEYEHVPVDGFIALRELAERKDTKIKVRTTFFALSRADARLPEPAEEANCTKAQLTPVIGALALLVMKSLEDTNYWNVSEELPTQEEATEAVDEGEEEEEGEATQLQRVVDALQSKEAAQNGRDAVKPVPALSFRGNSSLMNFTEPTRRGCGSKLVVRSQVPLEQAEKVFRSCLNSSDALIMVDLCGGDQDVAFERHMFMLGTRLVPRHALLLVVKNADGSIERVSLLAHDGEQAVSSESITRYLMFPWVTPLVLDNNVVSELKLQGVAREVPCLDERHRVAAIREVRDRVPQSVVQFISEATEALKQAAALPARLEALENAVTARPAVSPLQAAVAAPPPVAASAPVATLGTPGDGDQQPSAILCGLKRTLELLEAYDEAIAR